MWLEIGLGATAVVAASALVLNVLHTVRCPAQVALAECEDIEVRVRRHVTELVEHGDRVARLTQRMSAERGRIERGRKKDQPAADEPGADGVPVNDMAALEQWVLGTNAPGSD